MASIKRKKCCVPYCNNVQHVSKKQFFKIGTNLDGREKWLPGVGKATATKSQVLFCCEDHFDLPNDAENYIRYKYDPGTKLKLRSNILPQKKMPVNVCRLCLKLIYNGDDFIEISEKKGYKNAQIIAATLPELDLSITVEPVACVKCFSPLEQYYKIKQNSLNCEMIVVNCIKSIVKRSPTRLVTNCEIDLFEEYNDIVELLYKKNDKSRTNENSTLTQDLPEHVQDKQDTDRSTEELIIQIEESSEDKYKLEGHKKTFGSGQNHFATVLQGDNINGLMEDTHSIQKNVSPIKNITCNEVPKENNHEKINLNTQSLQDLSNTSVECGDSVQYKVAGSSTENMYIHIEKTSSEDVVIVSSEL